MPFGEMAIGTLNQIQVINTLTNGGNQYCGVAILISNTLLPVALKIQFSKFTAKSVGRGLLNLSESASVYFVCNDSWPLPLPAPSTRCSDHKPSAKETFFMQAVRLCGRPRVWFVQVPNVDITRVQCTCMENTDVARKCAIATEDKQYQKGTCHLIFRQDLKYPIGIVQICDPMHLPWSWKLSICHLLC